MLGENEYHETLRKVVHRVLADESAFATARACFKRDANTPKSPEEEMKAKMRRP